MDKIIFLDIDGVLNVRRYRRDMFGSLFHRSFVHNLKQIIDITGAKIVISSSWRTDGLKTMQDMWKVRKLPGEVIDVTPIHLTLPESKKMLDQGYRDRSCEIQEWLLTHPVESFVILDDDCKHFYPYHRDRLVVCSGDYGSTGSIEGYGLTKARANLAIHFLVRKWSFEIKSATLPVEYAREWNTHLTDFIHLHTGGVCMRDTYYRVGGLRSNVSKGKYFMLLKYSEDIYDDSITTDPKNKKYLKGEWCILDDHGNERVVFSQFDSPCLIKDSPVYKLNDAYYNIETGKKYCEASTHIESEEYIFIDNHYDKVPQNRGIMVIGKKTGKFEIIP